jgi:hypothetical protein
LAPKNQKPFKRQLLRVRRICLASGWIGIEFPRIHDDALTGHIREAYRLIVSKKKRKRA